MKKLEYSEMTYRTVSYYPSYDKTHQIYLIEKSVIILESDKEYLEYTLFEKDVELGQLHENVKNLSSFFVFLESTIQEKEDVIRALREKNMMFQEELTHSLSKVCNLMLGTPKLNKVCGSIKAT